MKVAYTVSPDLVIAIAQMIGSCDFRTTVSLYTTSSHKPWVITVGESNWRRHIIVEEVVVGVHGLEATLAVLPTSESDKFGYDIRTDKVDGRISLSDLVAGKYVGAKKVLYPPK